MKTINIGEVRRAVDLLFQHITEDMGMKEIPLTQDYYWNIPLDQIYEMETAAGKVAERLDVGSLVEDMKTVDRVLGKPEARLAIQLAELAPLLRYLGKTAEDKRFPEGSTRS